MLTYPTVNDFVTDSYQLISASNPTTPIPQNALPKGVQFLNQLLKAYSSSSLLLTISQKINFILPIGQMFATFGDPLYTPTPTVTNGRLTNLNRAWLNLDGVDYPLINEDRSVFYGSYKFEPQLGLPRFIIIDNDLDVTTMQFYPGPSQQYTVFVYGKFELPMVVMGGTMNNIPMYYQRFLMLALARDLAYWTGRSSAWTQKLENMYTEARDDMESVSTMDTAIDSANESYLNGSWRLRAGI